MRKTTNQRISHTVLPNGLRIDYDYVQEEQIFVPTKQNRIKFKSDTVQIVLLILGFIIYILF